MTDTFIQHCITVYSALDDRAKIHELKSGEKARVFAGSFTEVFKSTGLSRTYYTSIRRALENHNAILILQKGSRNSDTVIVLRGLPDKWEIDGWNDGRLTKPPEYARLRAEVEEQLEEIKKSTGGLNVAAALVEFEKRVVTLETEVAELKKIVKTKTKK